MSDEPVSIPVTLISLGAERPVHLAVDTAENVPLKPPADAAPGEAPPLQVIEIEDLHAALDPGSLPERPAPV
jgi:hypothetical protein